MASISTMRQEEWLQFKVGIEQQIRAIAIPVDANPSHVRMILSGIDNIYTDIRLAYAEVEGNLNKTESLIRELERTKATGGNDIARKRNAAEHVQAYPTSDGGTVNLYEFQRSLTVRYSVLKGILDTLFNKQSRLITLNGMLKLEQNTSPHAGENGSPWG